MLLILSIFLLSHEVFGDSLLQRRYETATVWRRRVFSAEAMDLAYSDEYTVPETCHVVRQVGDYCPRDHAKEYDNIVVTLEAVMGFAPAKLTPDEFDIHSTEWVSENTLKVDFYGRLQSAYANGVYRVDGRFRFTSFLNFIPGSHKIINCYSINSPEVLKAYDYAASFVQASDVCINLIWPACSRPGMNYLNDTGFTTIEECIAYTSSLPIKGTCPYNQRSKTQACSELHAISSILLPDVHCQHVSPTSEKCQDTCLPACSNCDVNAKCIPVINSINDPTPTFKCECNVGYSGNGQTCKKEMCSYGNCNAPAGSYDCSGDNQCKCHESFTHNPENPNKLCVCPEGSKIRWINGSKSICVPNGRCVNGQHECPQRYNQVRCIPEKNTFSTMNECVCNHGYFGGRDYPCACPAPKRELWSNRQQGDLCLTPDECTEDWHCDHPRRCSLSLFPGSPSSAIGECM